MKLKFMTNADAKALAALCCGRGRGCTKLQVNECSLRAGFSYDDVGQNGPEQQRPPGLCRRSAN